MVGIVHDGKRVVFKHPEVPEDMLPDMLSCRIGMPKSTIVVACLLDVPDAMKSNDKYNADGSVRQPGRDWP
eukprot:6839622-Prymnesium_polylepis.1